MLLYRQGPGYEWTIPAYSINFASNPNDKRGSLQIDSLMKGEYTLGYYDYSVGLNQVDKNDSKNIFVIPNPSSDIFTFTFPAGISQPSALVIYDMGGRKVFEAPVGIKQIQVEWNSTTNRTGIYYAVLMEEGRRTASVKVMVAR